MQLIALHFRAHGASRPLKVLPMYLQLSAWPPSSRLKDGTDVFLSVVRGSQNFPSKPPKRFILVHTVTCRANACTACTAYVLQGAVGRASPPPYLLPGRRKLDVLRPGSCRDARVYLWPYDYCTAMPDTEYPPPPTISCLLVVASKWPLPIPTDKYDARQ